MGMLDANKERAWAAWGGGSPHVNGAVSPSKHYLVQAFRPLICEPGGMRLAPSSESAGIGDTLN